MPMACPCLALSLSEGLRGHGANLALSPAGICGGEDDGYTMGAASGGAGGLFQYRFGFLTIDENNNESIRSGVDAVSYTHLTLPTKLEV